MRRWPRFCEAGQVGFTVIETLIAIAISGVLGSGIVATISQIYNENNRATRNMQAVLNVETAGYWVSRDALMAQNITSSSFPITMIWHDWDGNTYQVTYTLTDGKLQRGLSINGGGSTQSTVAQNINADSTMTNCQFANGVIIFKVTATINSASETRTYQIKLRPESSLQ